MYFSENSSLKKMVEQPGPSLWFWDSSIRLDNNLWGVVGAGMAQAAEVIRSAAAVSCKKISGIDFIFVTKCLL